MRGGGFDHKYWRCLASDDVDKAIMMVTHLNADYVDTDGDGLVAIFCWRGGPDDPDLLMKLIAKGAPLLSTGFGALHLAVCRDKPKLVRKLIDLGLNIVQLNKVDRRPMSYVKSLKVAKILVDAGAPFKGRDLLPDYQKNTNVRIRSPTHS